MNSTNNYTIEYIEKLMLYKHYLNGWLIFIICIIGLIFNSLTIYIRLHKSMQKTSTNAYLIALTISNIVNLICLLILTSLRFILVNPYTKLYNTHWYEQLVINTITPYLAPLNNAFQLSGIYLTCAVSIDRYLLIRTKDELINKTKRLNITYLIILIIFLFSFIFTLPNWFLYKKVKISTYSIIDYTSFGRLNSTRFIINILLYIPFVFLIPISILLVINFLIILKLIKISKRKRRLTRKSINNNDKSVTVTLILIICLFIICQVPLVISHLLNAFYKTNNFNYYIFNCISLVFLSINLSFNFLFYTLFSQPFKKSLKHIINAISHDDKFTNQQKSSKNNNSFLLLK